MRRSAAHEVVGKYVLIAGGAAVFFAHVGLNLWTKSAKCSPGTFGPVCAKQWQYAGVTFHSGREIANLLAIVAVLRSVVVLLVTDNQRR